MNDKEISPLAIASLSFSCLGALTLGILAIPGIICGHLAKKQVRLGLYSGHSLAQAGMIVGFAVLILWLVIPLLVFGGIGIVALIVNRPLISALIFVTLILLALLPFAFLKLAKQKDRKSLSRIVSENKDRGNGY